jgi:hypothetical protein
MTLQPVKISVYPIEHLGSFYEKYHSLHIKYCVFLTTRTHSEKLFKNKEQVKNYLSKLVTKYSGRNISIKDNFEVLK